MSRVELKEKQVFWDSSSEKEEVYMAEDDLEKQQLKRLVGFSYATLASLFSFIFLLISLILSFLMTGILDVQYFPSKIAIVSFALATLFSLLAIKGFVST